MQTLRLNLALKAVAFVMQSVHNWKVMNPQIIWWVENGKIYYSFHSNTEKLIPKLNYTKEMAHIMKTSSSPIFHTLTCKICNDNSILEHFWNINFVSKLKSFWLSMSLTCCLEFIARESCTKLQFDWRDASEEKVNTSKGRTSVTSCVIVESRDATESDAPLNELRHACIQLMYLSIWHHSDLSDRQHCLWLCFASCGCRNISETFSREN